MIPVAGYRSYDGAAYAGTYGYYWSSSPYPSSADSSYTLDFNSSNVFSSEHTTAVLTDFRSVVSRIPIQSLLRP